MRQHVAPADGMSHPPTANWRLHAAAGRGSRGPEAHPGSDAETEAFYFPPWQPVAPCAAAAFHNGSRIPWPSPTMSLVRLVHLEHPPQEVTRDSSEAGAEANPTHDTTVTEFVVMHTVAHLITGEVHAYQMRLLRWRYAEHDQRIQSGGGMLPGAGLHPPREQMPLPPLQDCPVQIMLRIVDCWRTSTDMTVVLRWDRIRHPAIEYMTCVARWAVLP